MHCLRYDYGSRYDAYAIQMVADDIRVDVTVQHSPQQSPMTATATSDDMFVEVPWGRILLQYTRDSAVQNGLQKIVQAFGTTLLTEDNRSSRGAADSDDQSKFFIIDGWQGTNLGITQEMWTEAARCDAPLHSATRTHSGAHPEDQFYELRQNTLASFLDANRFRNVTIHPKYGSASPLLLTALRFTDVEDAVFSLLIQVDGVVADPI